MLLEKLAGTGENLSGPASFYSAWSGITFRLVYSSFTTDFRDIKMDNVATVELSHAIS